jgi:hypothetical protein
VRRDREMQAQARSITVTLLRPGCSEVFDSAVQPSDFLNGPALKNDSLVCHFRIAGIFNDDCVPIGVKLSNQLVRLGIHTLCYLWRCRFCHPPTVSMRIQGVNRVPQWHEDRTGVKNVKGAIPPLESFENNACKPNDVLLAKTKNSKPALSEATGT